MDYSRYLSNQSTIKELEKQVYDLKKHIKQLEKDKKLLLSKNEKLKKTKVKEVKEKPKQERKPKIRLSLLKEDVERTQSKGSSEPVGKQIKRIAEKHFYSVSRVRTLWHENKQKKALVNNKGEQQER